MDFEEQLKISKFDLDTECCLQPGLFAEWAEKSVEAHDQRDRAKLKVEQIYAMIDNEIRKQASERGEKITEKQIESRIILDSRYIQAQEEYLKYSKDAATLLVARQAFEQRKGMIEMVCRLFMSEYFSEVSAKTGNKYSAEKAREKHGY